jgi:hypothetical protein
MDLSKHWKTSPVSHIGKKLAPHRNLIFISFSRPPDASNWVNRRNDTLGNFFICQRVKGDYDWTFKLGKVRWKCARANPRHFCVGVF